MPKYRSALVIGLLICVSLSACNYNILHVFPRGSLTPSVDPTVQHLVVISVSSNTVKVGESVTVKGIVSRFNSEQYLVTLSSGGSILTTFENHTVIQQTDTLFDIVSVVGHNDTVEVVLKARRAGTVTLSISVRGETGIEDHGTAYFDWSDTSSEAVSITIKN